MFNQPKIDIKFHITFTTSVEIVVKEHFKIFKNFSKKRLTLDPSTENWCQIVDNFPPITNLKPPSGYLLKKTRKVNTKFPKIFQKNGSNWFNRPKLGVKMCIIIRHLQIWDDRQDKFQKTRKVSFKISKNFPKNWLKWVQPTENWWQIVDNHPIITNLKLPSQYLFQ